MNSGSSSTSYMYVVLHKTACCVHIMATYLCQQPKATLIYNYKHNLQLGAAGQLQVLTSTILQCMGVLDISLIPTLWM